MLSPEVLNLSGSPAPVIHVKRVAVRYEDVCRSAYQHVLDDFARQQSYKTKLRHIREQHGHVQHIHVTEEQAEMIMRKSATRFLKDHHSASWGVQLYQTSLYGLTGVSTVGVFALTYLGTCHNRMFLPFVPLTAIMTWRLWGVLENVWEQKRYIDNAAKIREERTVNPTRAIVKRRRRDHDELNKDDKDHPVM